MKRRFKVILDIVMLLTVLTLFSKQLFGMQYHEIAGIILLVLMIVHIAVNLKIASAMGKSFARLPAAVKIGFIADILLILCFIAIGVSGILISHTILTSISSDNVLFKQIHMFVGGLSVILLGVHLGLHICRRPLPCVAAAAASVIVLCAGIYGVLNSSEVRWLSMPFTGSARPAVSDSAEKGGNYHSEGQGSNVKQFRGSDQDSNGNAEQSRGGGKNRQPFSPAQKAQNIIMFSGMLLSCTAITYWAAVPKKKKRPRASNHKPH